MLAKVNIVYKLTAVIVLIGAVIAGCIWFAASQMTSIDDSYRAFIAQETKAASSARRVNRAVFEMNYALYRAIAETETAQVTAAEARFAAAKALGAQTLMSIRDQAPSFA